MYTEQCPAYDSLSLSAMLSAESAGAEMLWSSSSNTSSSYQEYNMLPTIDGDSQWLPQLMESSPSGATAPKRRGPGRPRPYGHVTPPVGRGPKGGRARKDQQLSEEDQDKVRIRRERNKVAAAKVRTRRQQLTDTLEEETAKLAAEQATIRAELQQLQKERDELELMLATHEPACRLQQPALAHTLPDSTTTTTTSQGLRAPRPTSLPLPRLQLKQEPDSTLYGQQQHHRHHQQQHQQQLYHHHHHHQQQQPAAHKHEQMSSQLTLPCPQPCPQPCTQLQVNHEAESGKTLHTPVVSLTPCSGSGSFVFTYPSLAGLQDLLSSESHSCASALRRQSSSGGSGELGTVGSDSLLSPTILSL